MCPNCGKRFEIRLVGKKLLESESLGQEMTKSPVYLVGYMGPFSEVGETDPVTIDIEKLQYAYKCKHCGHKWVEIRDEEH